MNIVSLFLSIAAVIISFASFVLTLKWERKRATVEAYKDLQEDLFFIYEYESAEEIALFVDNYKSEEYKVLSSALASIESFAICTFNDTYDKRMVYELAHGYIDGTLREKIEYLLDLKKTLAGDDFYPFSRRLLDWMIKRSV